MTTDHALIKFTNDRLDEDEAVAQTAGGPAPQGRWEQVDPERRPGRIDCDSGCVVTYDEGSPDEGQAEHIARHDPARVLREIEAKRRIVDDYRITASAIDMITGPDIDTTGYKEMCAGRDALRASVLALAAIWNTHPDYPHDPHPEVG